MTAAMPIVRSDVRELTDEEIAEATADGLPPVGPDGIIEVTEAELLLLEGEQGYTADVPERGDGWQPKAGDNVFTLSRGDARFTGKVKDAIGGVNDLVNIYNRKNQPVAVPRGNLRYYLQKVDSEGPIYRARPTGPAPATPFRCIATEVPCRKKFETELQAEEHFRNRHTSEFKRRVERDDLDDRRRAREMADAQIRLVEMTARASGIDTSGVVPEQLPPANLPKRDWSTQRIVEWMSQRGRDVPIDDMRLKPNEFIDKHFGEEWDVDGKTPAPSRRVRPTRALVEAVPV